MSSHPKGSWIMSKANLLLAITLICSAGLTRACSAVEPKADDKVVEGVGWGDVRLGATRDELIKAYGPFEPTKGSQRAGWLSRRHIDFFFDKTGHAVEVQFVKGFDVPLTSGIKNGSSEKDVLSAYGAPDRVVKQPKAKMLEYQTHGVLLWLMNGKVSAFTVFRSQPAATDSADSPLREKMMGKARNRMARDKKRFSEQELREMESLTQIADKNSGNEEARKAMKTLVQKYKNANRTGCSLVYLGQMSEGDEQIGYFREAIANHSDCFYGDGVQVGAFARFLLGNVYLNNGNAKKAAVLLEEIRKDYPDSIDHNGRSLVEQLPATDSDAASK
jgi:hypothetical protein